MKQLVAIGLGTKNRPQMLKEALESLVTLQIPEVINVHVIVCQNGNQSDISDMINSYRYLFAFDLSYLEEDRPGIVFVRNAILEKAKELEANQLAFFDDDEAVDSKWLVNLLEAKHKFGADIVQGHVVHRFPQSANTELLGKVYPGSFRNDSGDDLQEAYTNNVLFDLSLATKNQITFNPRFNLTGGSDSFFFVQLKEKGGKIIFCKEATVTESVPESRSTIQWVLYRFYRNGYTTHLMNVQRLGRVKAFFKGFKYVFNSFKQCGFKKKPLPQNESEVQLHNRCLRAKGILHAMLGIPFSEYHVTHGN